MGLFGRQNEKRRCVSIRAERGRSATCSAGGRPCRRGRGSGRREVLRADRRFQQLAIHGARIHQRRVRKAEPGTPGARGPAWLLAG